MIELEINLSNIDLPIIEVLWEVRQKLQQNNTLILTAPTGTGKSTILPLALLDEPWLHGQKILMLEPRRLAARMIAARMASLLGQNVGETVGYRIRLETRISAKTKIEVVTEGILTRMLQSDSSLEGIGLVIFDEFHERSIHADMALAFCRETQTVLRPDIRMLIMSATIDMSRLSTLLKAPTVEGHGRQFPVEIKYTGETDKMLLPEMTARIIVRALQEQKGDILAFFPGEGEIKKCEEILKRNISDISIHSLYSRLPQSQQNSAIFPDRRGKRKIVLATSIAETSLTIEGISIVVDCGFGRTSKFDPRSGLSGLETTLISQDSAEQRAGRAGRLSKGVCYRMWTKASHSKRIQHSIPEILEADLATLALEMAVWGIQDINELTWVTPPPPGVLLQAFETLEQLNAIENGIVTSHGKAMHQLSCHPRIAHLLVMAKNENLLPLATDLAALLEERDPLANTDAGIDINIRIEALRRYRSEHRGSARFGQIDRIAASYRDMFKITSDDGPVNPYETGILLVYAYPERIACARPGNNAQFQLSNGKLAMAHHTDDLAHESWLAVAHMDARDGVGKIFLASPLNPGDLAPMVKEIETIKWDTAKGGLLAVTEFRLGNILLQSKPLPFPNKDLVNQAIIDAIKNEGAQLLNFNDDVTQLQNRLFSLRKWRPDEGFPDVSTSEILSNAAEWMTPYLNNVKKNEDLEKLDLAEIIFYHLTPKQQKALEQFAPEKINVPSGSSIKILYNAHGSQPQLEVRLQEVFGLTDTPKVNGGNIPVIMHLQSPGFKLVQITSDLKSFWTDAYFEVRKEMKRRYPKHSWPDNPLDAEAVRGVKRK